MWFKKKQEKFRYLHGPQERIGILLVNLGSPEAPTTSAVRKYLAEFLWDSRVVDLPRPLWWLILHGIILRFRPSRSARAYQKVWTDQGSPLISISTKQAQAVEKQLQKQIRGSILVDVAMRYGKPDIASGLRGLRKAGAHRLLILPMYPQYSATTTASVFDAVTNELLAMATIDASISVEKKYIRASRFQAFLSMLAVKTRITVRGKPNIIMIS